MNSIKLITPKYLILICMFIDKAKIIVRSGSGGAGQVSFRREKFIPRGGPHGGNGGKGGSVYVVGDRNLTTLFRFSRKRHFFAENGRPGGNYNRAGAHGQDMVIHVPLGTYISFEDKKIYIDKEERRLLLPGGKGGIGNSVFRSSVCQTPYKTIPPQEGKTIEIFLELTLIGHVGFLGLPNAGKSTLLSAVTRADAKIGNYEFTTIHPQLGIYEDVILVDLPGLIRGASMGKGLGIRFLNHVKNCKYIAYIVDCAAKPLEDINILREEISNFGLEKHSILVLNKMENVSRKKLRALESEIKALYDFKEVFKISAQRKIGLLKMLERIRVLVHSEFGEEQNNEQKLDNNLEGDGEQNELDGTREMLEEKGS